MRPLLVLALASAGCGSAIYELDEELACDVDYLSTEGGLAYHLTQGEGDGAFDYAPDSDLVDRIAGSYDLAEGGFSWNETHVEDHWLQSRSFEGSGLVGTDGDLDLDAYVVDLLANGDTYEWSLREVRQGCDVEREATDDEGEVLWTETGTLRDGRYDYERRVLSSGRLLAVDGTRRDGVAYDQSVEYDNGNYAIESDEAGAADGEVTQDFVETWKDTSVEGTWDRAIDGSEHWSYRYKSGDPVVRVEADVDMDGDGEGTATVDGTECKLTFEAWDCSIKCPGQSKEACDSPLSSPSRPPRGL